jgi:phosphate starvation-inducible PhoH-like protein
MFLTRLGADSQMIVTGDVTQIDLEEKRKSGLIMAEKLLSGIEGIKIMHFTQEDVVRHTLVRKVIEAFEAHRKTS